MRFYSHWILYVSLAVFLWKSADAYRDLGGLSGEVTLQLHGRSVPSGAV